MNWKNRSFAKHGANDIHPSGKSASYRPEIDGIRAFAVTAIVINHFNKDLLPSGYLGVDIFFVISGFVITFSLADRPSKNFRDFLVGFYTRRIKRLVPALVLFVLITSVLICLFNPRPGFSIKTGITSLFGLSNLYLLKQSTDYFAASTELNVFTHTWSLGVEEQFYFLFPFLVWFTGFGRLATKGSRNLFWVTGVLSVASLIAFVYIYQTNQPTAYFLMPTRLWELGTGCLLFLGLKHFNRFLRTLESISPLMISGAVVGVLFVPFHFAVQATIAVVVLTAVLITCLRSGTAAYDLFTHPRVVYIGLISYSLYLWHWGVLSLSRWTIGIHWWSVPFQITLMLLLSIASYRYVEMPLRRSDWSAVRWQSIGYGMGASASAAVLLFALVKIPNLSLYIGRSPSLVAVGVSSLTDTYSLKQVNSVWRGKKCVLSGNSQVGKKILVEDCTLGNFSKAQKRVVVIGDSFAAAFTQAFDDLVVSDGYSVTITSCVGASPVKEIPNGTPWDKANNYYWDSVIPSLINRLRPGDWVFLVNDITWFAPKYRTSETDESLKQLKSGLETLSGKLSARGIRLAVLHSNPFARETNCQPVIAAKQWFSPFGGPCKLPSRSESLLRRDNLNKVLVSLEAEGKLRIVDIFDVFCPQEQCTYNAKNGQLLYRDEYSHPSVEGVRLSSPIIRKVLTS
jgi:peptidoglycan/LPS O-acetylase OafA/YrhL